jgi:hypothetical protein
MACGKPESPLPPENARLRNYLFFKKMRRLKGVVGKACAIPYFSTPFSTTLWPKRFDRILLLLYTYGLFRGIFPEQ